MSAYRLPATADLTAPSAATSPQWLTVLVELEQPAPAELAELDRGQRYALLADRTRRQCAELELWFVSQDLDDEVFSVCAMEAMGMLLIQCTRAVVAQLPEAPGVASMAVTGSSADGAQPTALLQAYA